MSTGERHRRAIRRPRLESRPPRSAHSRRGKGTRGGLRIIYYYWIQGPQCWLFTLYGKDEADDLTAKERAALKDWLTREIKARKS